MGSTPTVRTPDSSTLSALTNSERLLYCLTMMSETQTECGDGSMCVDNIAQFFTKETV